MADYTQVTLFTPKDSLPSGNSLKRIRGSEYDAEFSAISASIATKYDSVDLASDAEAAALTSDTVLMTPDKVGHALQNASIILGAGVQLSGGIAATDVARKSAANTFTANQTLSSAEPRLLFHESDQGTDGKYWAVRSTGGVFAISTLADDGTTIGGSAINVTRSGNVVTSVNLAGTAIQANGSAIWTAANDGAGSGLDADLLDGMNAVSSLATANTIVYRDANGDFTARYISSTSSNNENPTVSQIMVTNGSDNVIRKAALAHVLTSLDVPNIAYCTVRSTGTLTGAQRQITSATRNSTGNYTVVLSGTWTGSPSAQVTVSHGYSGAFTQVKCTCNAITSNIGVTCHNQSTGALVDTDFMLAVFGA